jgi:hypothetical protein
MAYPGPGHEVHRHLRPRIYHWWRTDLEGAAATSGQRPSGALVGTVRRECLDRMLLLAAASRSRSCHRKRCRAVGGTHVGRWCQEGMDVWPGDLRGAAGLA